tara:strand:+ start:3147 stop:4250 length:1104 start_codon:yes stop_codon:yes gene_type:complete
MSMAALLNSLAAVSSSTSTISSAMTGIGNLVSGLGTALKNAFGNAADWAVEKFNGLKDWFNEHIMPLLQPFLDIGISVFGTLQEAWGLFMTTAKDIFNSVLMPIWGAMESAFGVLMSLFSGDWEGAMTKAQEHFNTYIMPIWDNLVEKVTGVADFIRGILGDAWDWAAGMFETHLGGKIDWLQEKFANVSTFISEKWSGFTSTAQELWNTHVQPLFDNLSSIDPFTPLSNAFDSAMNTMTNIYDSTLGPVIDVLSGITLSDIIGELTDLADKAADVAGGALGKIAGWGKSAVGGVADAAKSVIPGGSDGGGGGAEGTTGASSINQTFNMTFEVSGVTDRSDKRALATEISAIIQEEIARNSGTTTFG